MTKLVITAPAKINWRLLITGRRHDGYHLLDMYMQTISLRDVLTVEKSDFLSLTVNGAVADKPEKNLVWRAAKEIGAYTKTEIRARFDLQKNIPAMAGLGGGSSDAASALIAINELYGLNLSAAKLESLALKLGSDVPFFLKGGLCRVTGTGETVEKLPFSPIAHLLVWHVGAGLSTPQVYGTYDRMGLARGSYDDGFETILKSGDYMRLEAVNDLYPPALKIMPEIGKAIETLQRMGAMYAMMSGSGSAVFGVFKGEPEAKSAQAHIPDAVYCSTTDCGWKIFK